MNFEEFKKLIIIHPDQLGDRDAYTDLQRLSIALAKESPKSEQKKNIEDLLLELVNENQINHLTAEQTAGLMNFVNDSIFQFRNDLLLRMLKNYLAGNLKREDDLLKRAHIVKLIMLINKNEYSPNVFFEKEKMIAQTYPWLYADIIAQSGNFNSLTKFIIELFDKREFRERTFAHLMNHLEIWWSNRIIEKNDESKNMIKSILKGIESLNMEKSKIDNLNNWIYSKELYNGDSEQNFSRIKKISGEISLRSIDKVPLEMELAYC